MKRRLVIGLVGAALSNAAAAQSSVTLSGSLDNGITYINKDGGSHNVKADSGVSLPNWWTLSGKEDLGGGYQGLFELSSIFDLNSGQTLAPNTEFGRRAWVGLGTPYGTVSLGKQWDFTADFFNQFNVSVLATGYGIHVGDFDRTNNDRLTNSVKYVSPTLWGGFSFGAMYGFRSTAQGIHDGTGWSTGAQYANGPLAVAATYTFVANPLLDPYAQIGTRTFLGVPVATVSNNTATDLQPALQIDSLGTFGIGASYAIGKWTLYGNFTDTTLKNLGQKSVMHVYEGGATYQMTPEVFLIGAYQHTTFEGHAWNQGSAGVQYYLSKRTDLYLGSDYIKASAGVDPVLGAASFAPSLSRGQVDVRIGVHTFF
jgi:outer membrane protein OmpU